MSTTATTTATAKTTFNGLTATNGDAASDFMEISESNNNNNDKNTITPSLIPSVLFGIMSMWLFLIPDVTYTKRLATKWGGACGFAMASFLFRQTPSSSSSSSESSSSSYTLSPSYQRGIYGGLLLFCLCGLPSGFPGEGGYWAKPLPGILTAVSLTLLRLYGGFVSWKGWKESFSTVSSSSSSFHTSLLATSSSSENDKAEQQQPQQQKQLASSITKEFVHTLKLIWQTAREMLGQLRHVTNNKKSLFYRNSVLLILFMAYSNFMQGLFQWRYRDDLITTTASSAISMKWSATLHCSSVARLLLIASIVLSLKRAAEDDLLTKPIFVQMNYMIAIWSFIVAIGKGIYLGGFMLDQNVMQLLFFAFLFAVKGYKGQRQRVFPLTNTMSSSSSLSSKWSDRVLSGKDMDPTTAITSNDDATTKKETKKNDNDESSDCQDDEETNEKN